MSEKYSLKWNDFHSNVSKPFKTLRNEEYLQDVTLVDDDDFQVKAHKLVLSASSSYFKKIFTRNTESSIVLCLEGTTQADLQNILDYIYHGEVQIAQEYLDRFLNVAERLKLEGLIGSGSADHKIDKKEPDEDIIFDPQYTNFPNNMNKNTNPKNDTSDLATIEDKSTIHMKNEDLAMVNEKINQSYEKISTGVFKCNLCGKESRGKSSDMRKHVETHLEGLSYPCQQCGKTFRSNSNFKQHVNRNHN